MPQITLPTWRMGARMTYQVSRDGQMYGPYTLEDLQRYVASGNILGTDMAKSEEMPDWLPVAQILGIAGTAGTTSIPGPAAIPPPAYASPSTYPAPSGIAYPDPPNLNWGLDLLLWFLTCSLFNKVYVLVQAAWLQRIQPNSRALMLYIIATVIAVINIFASFSLVFVVMSHRGAMPPRHPLTSVLGLLYICMVIGARFAMRSALEEHYNVQEPIGLRLDPVMTFFFGGIYFQYKLNEINQMKQALRYGNPAR